MKRRGKIRGLVWLAAALTLAVALGLCARQWAFGTLRVAGTSMRNTLTGGDIALVTRFDYLNGGAPKRFEVVECRFPGRGDTYIKRVIGLPGDTISVKSGVLYINGEEYDEPFLTAEKTKRFSLASHDFEVTVPEGCYFVMGDNRDNSNDSRASKVGFIDAGMIEGKVRYILFPFNRIGSVAGSEVYE